MKKFSLYGIVSGASLIIRQFFLPNPFECFGTKAVLYNWIAEPFLHIIAFALVGLVYFKGSFPAFGSFLYLITYSGLVGVLMLFGIFKFAWFVSLVIGFILLVFGIQFIVSKINATKENGGEDGKS